ncbi:MFS transporter [soil metagenome]
MARPLQAARRAFYCLPADHALGIERDGAATVAFLKIGDRCGNAVWRIRMRTVNVSQIDLHLIARMIMTTNRQADSGYSWFRLAISLALSTIGGIGLWSAVVVMPAIESEFGISRAGAALPYTATMIGSAVGGVLVGRLVDRLGIMIPLISGAAILGIGFVAAAVSSSYWQFVLAQALLIGMLGSSVTFGPLVAEVSLWFLRKRGLAIGIVASGNYLAGTIWPPFMQHAIESVGWRYTYVGIGILCSATMLPLAFLLRERPPATYFAAPAGAPSTLTGLAAPPRYLQPLLLLAGVACCVAMSMPQVHIVAYCSDLGYGPASGAEMLSLMLGLGVVSRLASGFIADKIGGEGTLLLGSALQCLALLFYLPFDGLMSLYVVSALFGLAQGGIVPSYALIVREYYPARDAATRISLVFTATVIGMAFGGWMSGAIYDFTRSYQAAFLNGIAWNLINISIAGWLLFYRFGSRIRLAQ